MSKEFKERMADKQYLKNIILPASEKRNLFFFIGAGVSRLMGVPGWDEFSEILIKAAFPNYADHQAILTSITGSKERITIAYEEFNRKNQIKKFYKHFAKAMTPRRGFKASSNIYELLNKFEANFLTTNADDLFEKVLGSEVCHDEYDLSLIKSDKFKKTNHLFYLHGHYTTDNARNEEKLVFTADQYVKRYNDRRLQDFLSAVFGDPETTIIFIGYGLNEYELIDYIVTKARCKGNKAQNVYVLQGFCSNQDIVYYAKKAYFDALEIELIPFDMDEQGHGALFGVLEDLYEKYSKSAIPPLAAEIEEYAKQFSQENLIGLIHYLNNPDLAHICEAQIVREINKHPDQKWAKGFFEKGLFDVSCLKEKIEFRAWPLLELLENWVATGKKDAQDAGVSFLGALTQEHIQLLSDSGSWICKSIISIILSLDTQHISEDLLNIIKRLNIQTRMLYLELDDEHQTKNIAKWEIKHFVMLFDIIFGAADFKRDDLITYTLKEISKIMINIARIHPHLSRILFDSFSKILLNHATKADYNAFARIENLQHIEKDHEECWELFLNAVKNTFALLPIEEQKQIIEQYLGACEMPSQKLGLHLARVYDIAPNLNFEQWDFYSHYEYYFEFYMFIKMLAQKGLITQSNATMLCDKIGMASWGADKKLKEQNSWWIEYTDSKRLAILLLLPFDECQAAAKTLLEKGITPFDPIAHADRCDYTVFEWEHETYYTKEQLQGVPLAQWMNFYQEHFPKKDTWDGNTAADQFAEILLEQSSPDLAFVIDTLKDVPITKLVFLVNAFTRKRDALSAHKEKITSFLLEQFSTIRPTDKNTKDFVYAIIRFFDRDKIENAVLANQLIELLVPILNVSIHTGTSIQEAERYLDYLINNNDYDKYSLFIKCLVCLKRELKQDLSNQNLARIIELLKGTDVIVKYTLCYHYQNIRYISPQNHSAIFAPILNCGDDFDITHLLLCIVSSNYLFDELIASIKTHYLPISSTALSKHHNGVLSHQFYHFIVAAYFHQKISDAELTQAFSDEHFIHAYWEALSNWSKHEIFDSGKHIGVCWDAMICNFGQDYYVKHAPIIFDMLNYINTYTEKELEIFSLVAGQLPQHARHIKNPERLVAFFNVDKKKAKTLLESIMIDFHFWKDDEIAIVLQKYKDANLINEGRELITALSRAGIINLAQCTSFKKILE